MKRPTYRAYLANRMTNVPQFNYPWFDEAARDLRTQGHTIFSPAEMDDPETRAAALASPDGAPGSGVANGETWGDFLSRDVKLIADSNLDAIIVGPEWHLSKGARLETFVAFQLGLKILKYPNLKPVTEAELVAAWLGASLDGWTPAAQLVAVNG
jgi:hypothetical protein